MANPPIQKGWYPAPCIGHCSSPIHFLMKGARLCPDKTYVHVSPKKDGTARCEIFMANLASNTVVSKTFSATLISIESSLTTGKISAIVEKKLQK